jgi:hypothetical protein
LYSGWGWGPGLGFGWGWGFGWGGFWGLGLGLGLGWTAVAPLYGAFGWNPLWFDAGWPYAYVAGAPFYYVQPQDYSTDEYWHFINKSGHEVMIYAGQTQDGKPNAVAIQNGKECWMRKTPGGHFSLNAKELGDGEPEFETTAPVINIISDGKKLDIVEANEIHVH